MEILQDEYGNEYLPIIEKDLENPTIKAFVDKSIPMWFRIIVKDPNAMIYHLPLK